MRSGAILALTDIGFIGWAFDNDEPEKTFRVAVTANGRPVGVGMTAKDGSGLVTAVLGESRPTFTVPFPKGMDFEFPINVELRDTNGRQLGDPLTIERAEHLQSGTLRPLPTAYEGFCEQQTGERLEGWVWNQCVPGLPVVLEIVRNGTVCASIVADQFRPDLADAGKRGGYCGFAFALDDRAGPTDAITVRVAGTRFRLRDLASEKFAVQYGAHHRADGAYIAGPSVPGTSHERAPGTRPFITLQQAEPDIVDFAVDSRFDSKVHDRLKAQEDRLSQQEAMLNAVSGTVDNLVRAWLQVSNDISRLRVDIAALPATMVPAKPENHHLSEFEGRLGTLEAGWRTHISAFLNAISTVGALGHELAALKRRLEAPVKEQQQGTSVARPDIEPIQPKTTRRMSKMKALG